MFLRNVGWLSAYYTALYPRRQYSSVAYEMDSLAAVSFDQIISAFTLHQAAPLAWRGGVCGLITGRAMLAGV
jgi:hypothetical protein